MTYTVTTQNGGKATFKTEADARRYADNYGGHYTGRGVDYERKSDWRLYNPIQQNGIAYSGR